MPFTCWLLFFFPNVVGSDQIFHLVRPNMRKSQGAFLWYSHLCLVNHMQWFCVCVCVNVCRGVWCLRGWFCLQPLMAHNPFVCRLHCVDVLAGLLIACIAHPRSDEWMSVRGYCELWIGASILTSTRTRLGHDITCVFIRCDDSQAADANCHIVHFSWCDAQWKNTK